MKLDADFVFAGAGCAGLSLAWHLVERGVRNIVLLDPRERYDRDRTFCFWNVVDHPFEAHVSHRWPRWRVRDIGTGWITRSAPGIEYHHLPADAFYRAVRERIERTEGVELRLGVRVESVREERDRVIVETDRGSITGRALFDSRPPAMRAIAEPGREITLLQHFEGWEIRADSDAFDTDTATLMDFAVAQAHGVHFFYVLPLARDRALVEATWFGTRVLDRKEYAAAIERYLREDLRIERFEIEHREHGVIPMSTEAPDIRASERVYRIGLAGGMGKPSTGYAFQAIQRFSRAMAERLGANELPDPPEPRPWRTRTLDRIFLSHLARYPERGPSMLTAMFERLDPAVLVRFLSDEASGAECLRAMSAMPLLPFTAETLRTSRLWLRR